MFDDVRTLYQDVILERSRAPRHMRKMACYDAKAFGDNPLCGDQVEITLHYAPDGTVAEAAFEARGCAISLAAADLMIDAVQGKTAEEIGALAKDFGILTKTGEMPANATQLDGLRVLGGVSEYPSRIKCALLPWNALMAALTARPENQHG